MSAMKEVFAWNRVNPQEIAKKRKKMIRGVEVQLLVSPYDIPEAVRGFYNNELQRFVIEFRYIGDEGKEERHDYPHDNVSLVISKRSGRLLKVFLDLDAMNAEAVRLNVRAAIEELVKERKRDSREENYEIAQQILAGQLDSLTNSTART